jgi:hypothetical protein
MHDMVNKNDVDYPLYVNSDVDKLFKKFDASVYRKKLGDNHKVHGIKNNGK